MNVVSPQLKTSTTSFDILGLRLVPTGLYDKYHIDAVSKFVSREDSNTHQKAVNNEKISQAKTRYDTLRKRNSGCGNFPDFPAFYTVQVPGRTNRFTIEISGKDILAAFGTEEVFVCSSFLSDASEFEIVELAVQFATLRSASISDPSLRISSYEMELALNYLIDLNISHPSEGITDNQKQRFLQDDQYLADVEAGSHGVEKLRELDILPSVSPHVYLNVVDFIARNRSGSYVYDEKDQDTIVGLDYRIDKIWSEISNRTKITKVVIFSFGSPWHHALWNILSVEAIKGDLEGEFGHKVDVTIKRAVLKEEVNAVIDEALSERPDIVGLSVELGTLDAVELFLERIDQFRETSNPIIAIGNQVPTYFPERFLNDDRLSDAVVCLHEGELVMRGLVRVSRGEQEISELNNVVYRKKGETKITRAPLVNAKMSELPHPPSMDTCRSGITNMLQTSRGCIFGCTYCTRWSSWNASRKVDAFGEVTEPSTSTKWRPFELSRVVRNIEHFVAAGIHEFEFCDDEFFGGVSQRAIQRVELFCDAIERISQKYNVELTYRLFTTPLIISRSRTDARAQLQNETIFNLLNRLKGNGLVRVYIGLESGDKNQKNRYARRESLADTSMALETLRSLDLDIDVGFIMFDPYLTISELLNNINFFESSELVRHNTWPFRPLVVNEGTVMKQNLERDGLLTGDSDPEFLSYDYRFNNPDIQIIGDEVENIAKETMPIFYTLKTVSKANWDRSTSTHAVFAQEMVEENAIIYLRYMRELGELGEGIFDLKQRLKIQSKVRSKILNLVDDTMRSFLEGMFDLLPEDKKVLARHLATFWENYGDIYSPNAGPKYRLPTEYLQERASRAETAEAISGMH